MVDQPSVKDQIFELGSEDSTNPLDLPSMLVSYIHKYMAILVSHKDKNGKILETAPHPKKHQKSQKLDEYIIELLIENKKNAILWNED